MKIKFLLILLSITGISFGQNLKKQSSIIINSKYYLDSNFLIQGGIFSDNNSYNDFSFIDTTSLIGKSAKQLKGKSGDITVKVSANYPHPFQVAYFDNSKDAVAGSFYFFVGDKPVNIKIENLFEKKNVLIGKLSKENNEYLTLQNLYKRYVNNQTGEIYDLVGKLHVLKQYVSNNPHSFVALWDLVLSYFFVTNTEDKKNVRNIVHGFSVQVKKSKTFKTFISNIDKDLQLIEGNQMPNILLNGKDSLLAIASENNYTLIDFWYSGCKPCLEQFGPLQKIYNTHKQNRFEIVGISSDRKEWELAWKKVIQKFKLPWPQYWDIDGVETTKLNITSFPTNFLLDKKGKIVRKDISPENLEAFLREKLN